MKSLWDAHGSNQAYQHVDKRVKNGKFNSFLPGNSP